MAGRTVQIGCKLPHGLVLHHPMDVEKKVVLEGMNKNLILGAKCKLNTVDADFWEQWSALHKDFGPIKSGAIFVAKDESSAMAIAKEFADRKTGFEPLPQESEGVKPAEKE